MLGYVKPLSRTDCYSAGHCQMVCSITWPNGVQYHVTKWWAVSRDQMVCSIMWPNGVQYHVTKWWASLRCRCNRCSSLPSGYICAFCEMWLVSRSNMRTIGWASARSPVMLHELVQFSLCTAAVMASSLPVGTCSCHRHLLPVSWRPCCNVETVLVLDGVNQSDVVRVATH